MEEASGRAGMGRCTQATGGLSVPDEKSALCLPSSGGGAWGGEAWWEPRGQGLPGAQLGWSVYLPGCDMGP